MAKLTLLQIVQEALSLIDADNVSAIDETTEAEQVVTIVKMVYQELVSDFPWYHKREFTQLEATPYPHILAIPDGVEQLLSKVIYYKDEPVHYIKPLDMKDMLVKRDKTLPNVDSEGAISDQAPTYWTTYDDENIVFDAYDDAALEAAETSVWVTKQPEPPEVGTDIPDLPHQLQITLRMGVLEHVFRTLKGDETAARAYGTKYIKTLMKAKRWAQKANAPEDTYKNNYGRKNTIRTRWETPSSRIIEGS